MTETSGILQKLSKGPVVGDGSVLLTLEKRGYCRAGAWTPEAVIKYPEAVRQLLREFVRAGADAIQAPCFNFTEGSWKTNKQNERKQQQYSVEEINKAACIMAKEVASEGGALVYASIGPVSSFVRGENEKETKQSFEKLLKLYLKHKVDYFVAEYFAHIEELEICVEVLKRGNLPVACTMRIGPTGDLNGVSVEECAIRMAKTGADIIGINCLYDPVVALKTMQRIKSAVDKAGLSPYLMCQPLGWMCPEVEHHKMGHLALHEFPFALDSRSVNRFEFGQFARKAFELGVKYIGGCCGTEPHHIRAIAQELQPERGIDPPVNDMCPQLGFFADASLSNYKKKSDADYWKRLVPGTGRMFGPPCVEIDEDCERV
uniref:betaine--homocysteine S-methyltransferase 1-like isoform X2 n=1 Tax=Ciona intestinalis TaxID=7719 RepID=UPI000EF43FC3|nr:betaine--homocysteine S-methyltransferase 1-like isoform X2 [Ciona intestinalis]|eukprot:XP_026689557.1 betaine--homocysteine S-methyltransferase 1-like isoform X2 [Ciona intestinalis]